MSVHSIKNYQAEVEKLIHFGGSKNEKTIKNAFCNLLNEYAIQKHLMMIPEVPILTKDRKKIIPDGTLKDIFRQDWGYWESKDEYDNIDQEIEIKLSKGYPKDNILFEDSKTAILIRNGIEVIRVSMKDPEGLHCLIEEFVNFERPEVATFRKAIELFKNDIPKVTESLRDIILKQNKENPSFVKARDDFLELCRESINPDVVIEDVREMLIQHILTEDIFNNIFDEPYFHRENNIANELEKVIKTFFFGDKRRAVLSKIQHYYKTINAAAAGIPDHHEKQKFLKVLYENFYKSYNPKAADRLGVMYTPNEIVKFILETTDYLLYKHFDKFLEDKNVEILDPAVGTGTFICDLIDYLRKEKVEYKYEKEIHGNEVAILPYYIANLNIEFTYKQKIGEYREFKNLCFVDTLDNMGFGYKNKQNQLWALSTENTERIKNQNRKKISVIFGNPPYNANQKNENENNKNREYPEIDRRIKNTFVKYSNAQKTKVYDMYARFYRWAFDRINDNGIISFITNRSFIDSLTFDGFRKCVMDNFSYCYIIDTKSDVRANPKIAGTTHNVFGIQTGVALMFLVKEEKKENKKCQIRYFSLDDFWRKEQKLQYFSETKLKDIPLERLRPDEYNNWINTSDTNFGLLLSINKIFDLVTPGVNTARDEWVFDFDLQNLIKKVKYFIETYNDMIDDDINTFPNKIKWSSTLKNSFLKKNKIQYNKRLIKEFFYRPFVKKYYYSEKNMSDRLTKNHYKIAGNNLDIDNLIISVSGKGSSKPFSVLAHKNLSSFDLLEKTICFPLYYFAENNERVDNISNLALKAFQTHYNNKRIRKKDIFYYIYSVLHNPKYRKTYEFNLKRELPRIPYYKNFIKWSNVGEKLLNVHTNYENVKPYKLKRIILEKVAYPNVKLKVNKKKGEIIIDEATHLKGVPEEVWEYRIGNRSALEWVLDQYKKKKPYSNIIAERFDKYLFADYKTEVIDLLKRICTVSIETVDILKTIKDEL